MIVSHTADTHTAYWRAILGKNNLKNVKELKISTLRGGILAVELWGFGRAPVSTQGRDFC